MTSPNALPLQVGAVIVHYNAADDLRRCLTSLARSSTPPTQIVIVDNSDDDQARTEAQEIASDFSAIHVVMGLNVGFGAGCNRGVDELGACDQILFINQDATVDRTALEALSTRLAKTPRLGAVSPLIVTQHGRVWFAGGKLNRSLARLTRPYFGSTDDPVDPIDPDWLNGCAMLVKRQAWDDVGGFDERYFLYWEDVDLSIRLRRSAWEIAIVLEAVVTHIRGREGDEMRNLSPALLQHSVRSRLIFVRGNLTKREKITAFPYTISNILRLLALSVKAKGWQIASDLTAVRAGLRGGMAD